MDSVQAPRTLVLACGALAHELIDICRLNRFDSIVVECLPAKLHMEPAKIPGALRERIGRVRNDFDQILIGYADCGTAGEIDKLCAEEGVERLPGAHCYQFFAGIERFDAMHDDDPTVFYLTDFLARHFDRFIMDGLGINQHPQLLEAYFGNYTRLCYLAQTDDPALDILAEAAAARLGLRYNRVATGYGELQDAVVLFGGQRSRRSHESGAIAPSLRSGRSADRHSAEGTNQQDNNQQSEAIASNTA